jgi:hypothetical protein
MTNKSLSGDCLSCESQYTVSFVEELVSQELPEHCPFCGDVIQDLQEEYIEDDDDTMDDEEWE